MGIVDGRRVDWIRSLVVSDDNRMMLSGCVSARICGWDVETGGMVFSLPDAHVHPEYEELNTINTLQVGCAFFFPWDSPSGSRPDCSLHMGAMMFLFRVRGMAL